MFRLFPHFPLNLIYTEVGRSALHVAVAVRNFRQCSGSARYILKQRYEVLPLSVTATFIDKALIFYLIILNII